MYLFIRNRIRAFILNVLSKNAIPFPGIHILNGHFLSIVPSMPNKVFEKQLIALRESGVEFIDFDIAVKRIVKEDFPENRCLAAFTFDDGFEECYSKIRPILNKYCIKACFFINPNFVDGDKQYKENFKKNIVFTDKNPMSWEQIRELQEEGHFIGAHTMDHIRLDIDDKEILEFQIGKSKKVIEEKLNIPCDYFAFPYGKLEHISSTGVDIAAKHFKYIFSQSNYKHYFSFNKKVINRRHFECDWPYKHTLYFLKKKKL